MANGEDIDPVWPGNVTEIPSDNANMTRCQAGSFMDSSEMDTCMPCRPGLYQPIEGQYSCISCEFFEDGNAYQNETHMTSCKRCPSGTERLANTSGTRVEDCQYVLIRMFVEFPFSQESGMLCQVPGGILAT